MEAAKTAVCVSSLSVLGRVNQQLQQHSQSGDEGVICQTTLVSNAGGREREKWANQQGVRGAQLML